MKGAGILTSDFDIAYDKWTVGIIGFCIFGSTVANELRS
jgi:hypothetical protein